MFIDDAITLKKLEVFLAYMSVNNMSRVSELFGQSSVSVHRSLHSLEEGLRCPLFRREGRNLIPLQRAYTFAAYAERAINECKEGVRQVHDAMGYNPARLNIGTNYSLTLRCLPRLLTALEVRKPGLRVDLTMDSNRELFKGLEDGSLDAVIVAMPDAAGDDELISIPLFQDEMYFAAPVGSRFAGRAQIDVGELRGERFITLKDGFAIAGYFDRCFGLAGCAPASVMRVDDIFSLVNLVSGGLGYSLLPGRLREFNPGIELISVAERYAARQHVTLLLRKSRERDPNLLALAAECRLYARADR